MSGQSISNKTVEELLNELKGVNSQIEKEVNKATRAKRSANELPNKIVEYNIEFTRQSELSKLDIAFVICGLALRETTSALFKKLKTERLDDQEAASNLHSREKSNRTQKYFASIEDIASNPVPFDCIRRTSEVHEDFKERNIKISGFNHRFTALGHDPLLGFVFGTANIMTNTITISTGIKGIYTYHVGTLPCNADIPDQGMMDKMYERANTFEMIQHVIERVKADKKEGFMAIGSAIVKEFIHLLSDVRTAKSLPIPVVSAFSPTLARQMQSVGFDTLDLTSNVAEYYIAKFIDFGILTIRDFWYRNFEKENQVDEECFQARLKKIEIYINDASVIGETGYMVINIINGNVQKAMQGYSFGGVYESMKKILNDDIILCNLQHEFVLKHAEKYIQSI